MDVRPLLSGSTPSNVLSSRTPKTMWPPPEFASAEMAFPMSLRNSGSETSTPLFLSKKSCSPLGRASTCASVQRSFSMLFIALSCCCIKPRGEDERNRLLRPAPIGGSFAVAQSSISRKPVCHVRQIRRKPCRAKVSVRRSARRDTLAIGLPAPIVLASRRCSPETSSRPGCTAVPSGPTDARSDS